MLNFDDIRRWPIGGMVGSQTFSDLFTAANGYSCDIIDRTGAEILPQRAPSLYLPSEPCVR